MSKRAITVMRILLVAAGAAALVLGLMQGDAAAVLRKAAMICLECIGIG